MGVPIFLLLFTSLILFTTPAVADSTVFKAVILTLSILTIVYYIFYLINQSATSSLIDPLTQTFNRDNLGIELKKMRKRGFLNSISLIQVANIAHINDHYGYEKGDKILQEFAYKLDMYLKSDRDMPILGRLQGADFVIGSVLEPDSIRKTLQQFTKYNNVMQNVDLDIKSAVSIDSDNIDKNIEHLYGSLHQKLDKDLKQSIIVQDVQNFTRFEQEIIQAFHEHDFDIRFKPVLSLQRGSEEIYEAVIKVRTKTFGKLPPKRYIPVINRLDLEQKFDLAIVETIALMLGQNEKNFAVSFNLSPFSLRSEHFAGDLFTIIEKYKVDPKRFIIELYENKVYHDIDKYKKTLNRLKGFGLRLCLDNFGAMNASLEYIKYLPIDMVQFDKEFSANLDDPSYKATLKAFISMNEELGIDTVLKWIDNKTQMESARQLGVGYVQGFYVGKLKTQKELQ